MIVVMTPGAAEAQVKQVVDEIVRLGGRAHLSKGEYRTIIGAIGDERTMDPMHLSSLEGVEKVVPVMSPWKLASREMHPDDSVITVGGGDVPSVKIGGPHACCLAGPCTVENREMLWTIAKHVKAAGAHILRGGAFKPRTSPYSFQGHGLEALKWLHECGRELGMPVCSEVMDTRQVEAMVPYCDVFQIGARNMQNFDLLKEVGKTDRPVVLKRGLSATVKDWLLSAEYIMANGNLRVILCERGIKTFEDSARYTLDVTSFPVLKTWTHLPVVIDPSHCCGKRAWVPAVSMGGMAAGANGILIEVHHNPAEAMCDGPQALLPEVFASLMQGLEQIAQVTGKSFKK